MTLYAYRKKLHPTEDDKFFVFDFGSADITDDNWKSTAETEIFFETRGKCQGDVWFCLVNK